ncbi:MAG: MATE family efflux transporter, partial [Bradymonadaceae bacterium]
MSRGERPDRIRRRNLITGLILLVLIGTVIGITVYSRATSEEASYGIEEEARPPFASRRSARSFSSRRGRRLQRHRAVPRFRRPPPHPQIPSYEPPRLSVPETRNIDATTGPLLGKSIQIAWPAVIQAILVNFYAFNDFLFIGLLGDEYATAALSACFAMVVINYTLLRVISTGAQTLISQLFGRGERSKLADVLRQAISGELVWSVLVGLGGLAALPFIVAISNAAPPVDLRIEAYLSIFYWTAPTFGLVMVVIGAFRACGNTRIPLALEVVSLCLNALLNFLLVLGPGPFPSLGITGAAIATAVSRGLPGIVGLVLIFRGHLDVDLTDGDGLSAWRPRWSRVRPMFRIGAFQSVSGFIYGSVYFVLNRMAGELGPAAQGGLGAGLRGIEWLGYAVADGFKTATMAVVGQNIGAEQPDR